MLLRFLIIFTFITFNAFFVASIELMANDTEVNSLLKKASKLYVKGEYKKASKILRSLHQKKPGYDPARFLMGAIQYERGNDTKALKLFEKIKETKVPPNVAFAWGAVYYKNEKFEKSEKGFKSVPASDKKKKAYADFYLGAINVKKGKFREAKYYLKNLNSKLLSKKLKKSRRKLAKRIREGSRSAIWANSEEFSSVNEAVALDTGNEAFEFQRPDRQIPGDIDDDKDQSDASQDQWQVFIAPTFRFLQNSQAVENANTTTGQLSLLVHEELVSVELNKQPSNASIFDGETIGFKGTFGNAGYDASVKSEAEIDLSGSSANVIQQQTENFGDNNLYTDLSLFGDFDLSPSLSLGLSVSYEQLWADYGLENGLEAIKGLASLFYQQDRLKIRFQSIAAYQNDKMEPASFVDIDNRANITFDLNGIVFSGFAEFLLVSGDRYQTKDHYRYVIVDPDLRASDKRTFSLKLGLGVETPLPIGTVIAKGGFFRRSFVEEEYPTRLYLSDAVEKGARSTFRGDLNYRLSIIRGLNMDVRAIALYLSEYYSEIDSESTGPLLIVVDGMLFGGGLGVNYTPYQWLAFGIEGSYSTVQFDDLESVEEKTLFDGINPSLLATITGFARVNVSF